MESNVIPKWDRMVITDSSGEVIYEGPVRMTEDGSATTAAFDKDTFIPAGCKATLSGDGVHVIDL